MELKLLCDPKVLKSLHTWDFKNHGKMQYKPCIEFKTFSHQSKFFNVSFHRNFKFPHIVYSKQILNYKYEKVCEGKYQDTKR